MKKVKTDTIIRTVLLALAIINQILAIMGKDKLPFTDDQIYQLVSLVATIVTSIVAWWKNNSFTQAALTADEQMKELKAKGK